MISSSSYNFPYSISLGSVVGGVPSDIVKLDPFLGKLDIVQVCPQNNCVADSSFLFDLKKQLPNSEIRFHANISLMKINDFRSKSKFPMCHVDLSTYHHDSFNFYWKKLVDILMLNGNPYTLHAGRRSKCTLTRMIENVKDLQDKSGVKVGVEGMYPTGPHVKSSRFGFLMGDLVEYLKVMNSGIYYAVDLSHVNIIKNKMPDSFDLGIVKDLIYHENCIELHVSGNDGLSDTHDPLLNNEWWMPLLNNNIRCQIISEERIAL